jgi:hypothetical protein
MAFDMDALDGLRPAERDRLEAFAAVFDRLDAGHYSTFTETVESGDVQAAKKRAIARVGTGPMRRTVRAAVGAFVDAATVAYSRRMALPDTFLLFQSLPDRAEDRVRFLGSVERAVVALILWDELEDEDRVALLGPWGPSVIPAIEDEGSVADRAPA